VQNCDHLVAESLVSQGELATGDRGDVARTQRKIGSEFGNPVCFTSDRPCLRDTCSTPEDDSVADILKNALRALAVKPPIADAVTGQYQVKIGAIRLVAYLVTSQKLRPARVLEIVLE
jgi:hypothetical protein